jgi:hypothetical protein
MEIFARKFLNSKKGKNSEKRENSNIGKSEILKFENS